MRDREFRHSSAPPFGSPVLIWAHSFCRSTLETYLEFGRQYPGIVRIVVCGKTNPELRARAGFGPSEFNLSDFEALDPSLASALALLRANADSIHMFCAYHGSPFFEALLDEALCRGMAFFLASEAPQNMEQRWGRQVAKAVYVPTILRHRVRKYVTASRFLLCYSGPARRSLSLVGWPSDKIEEFGYYPPTLRNLISDDGQSLNEVDAAVTRKGRLGMRFLATGTHCVHKSPRTLIEAVRLLADEGFRDEFHCVVAGEGKQTEFMKEKVRAGNLPVEFPGFVPLERLINLYQNADVFVATGISEPWGIRVNDAMNLGCPAIVSDGMGAVKLIRDMRGGWSYGAGSARDLAERMKFLIRNPGEIISVRHEISRSDQLEPKTNAAKLVGVLGRRFPG